MEEVQSWWEVPAISYYCSLLGHAFGLPEFNIESLERSLASEEVLVSEICTVLLQAIDPMPEGSNWREAASFTLDKHCKYNPFDGGVDSELSPWDRLDVLYSLCELRMECSDVIAILKNIEKWQLKVPAIGEDRGEMLYWYFTGTRIYCQNRNISEKRKTNRKLSKESLEKQGQGLKKLACESLLRIHDTPRSNMIKSRPTAHWSIVTQTLTECLSFTAQFENSTEPEEETLYRNLAKVVLPQVRSVVQEEERRMDMADGGRGLTRSGRKVVARFKNGFVATPKDDNEEEKEQSNGLIRSSKRRRTQPPQTTIPRRTTRSNCVIDDVPQGVLQARRPRTSRRVCKESSPEESHEESREDECELIDQVCSLRYNIYKGAIELSEVALPVESNESHEKTDNINKKKKKKKSIIVSKSSSKHTTLKDQVEYAVAAATLDKRRTVSPPEGADVELNDALNKVMVALVNHPEAWQFNEPVNEEFAPYYYQLTKNPRDFNQIDKNVIEYKYSSAEDFANDVHLVFTNCFDYNGPLNEYTRVARVLEKYFRRLMREFFDDFTFEVTSVIHPRKRPFTNRHKRIKEIQRSEISSVDETSRESTDDSHRDRRKPGPKPGQRSQHRTDCKTKRRVKRKKTEDQQQVSFTDLLSDTYPPQYQYPPHPSYHPGYHGYQYPPHMYDYHRAVNNEPTYIELSPARPKVQPKVHYKHDDEPLLFPLLPRWPLPRPSLPASSVPEEHMLRLLTANRPSQINSIDSTTAPSVGETSTTDSNSSTTSNNSKATPSDSKTKVSDSTTNPSDSTTNPSYSKTKPSNSTTKPNNSTTNPSDSTTKPSDSKTKPSNSTTKPSNSTTKPSNSTTKPSDSTTNHMTPSDSTTALSEAGASNIDSTQAIITEKAADSTKVHVTAQSKEQNRGEQSLNNEALSKDTSEASPKKVAPETPKPKPVERPVAEYAVSPAHSVYPGYYQYDAGYTGQGYPPGSHGYHSSPMFHAGYPYSPGYPHSYAASPGYPMGYAGAYHPGYHTPGYNQNYAGYSYSPGTQYNGYHPSPLDQQGCVTPLNSKQVSTLVRPGRGRGSRGPRRGRGSRGSRGGARSSKDNGHSNESNVNGIESVPNVEENPWIDRTDGLDDELSQKKKKESNVFDIRMKPKVKRTKS